MEKTGKTKTFFLVLFILISITLSGFIVYDKYFNNEVKEETSNESEMVSKIDKDEDYVYTKNTNTFKNVDIENNNKAYLSETISTLDIKGNIPFVNIDSEAAKAFNNIILKGYNNRSNKDYYYRIDNIPSYNLSYIDYDAHNSKTNVSVVLNEYTAFYSENYNYNEKNIDNISTYNFDKSTGNIIEDEDLIKLYDKTTAEIYNLIVSDRNEYIKENNLEGNTECDENSYDLYLNNSKLNIPMYINEEGKLVVIHPVPLGKEATDFCKVPKELVIN